MDEKELREEIGRLEDRVNEMYSFVQSKKDDFAKRDTVQRIFDRLDKQKERILLLSSRIDGLESTINALKGLPDALNELRCSIAIFNENVAGINSKIDELEESIEKTIESTDKKMDSLKDGIDEQERRGKLDIVDWITRNWDKLVIACGIVYLAIKDTI